MYIKLVIGWEVFQRCQSRPDVKCRHPIDQHLTSPYTDPPALAPTSAIASILVALQHNKTMLIPSSRLPCLQGPGPGPTPEGVISHGIALRSDLDSTLAQRAGLGLESRAQCPGCPDGPGRALAPQRNYSAPRSCCQRPSRNPVNCPT